MPRSAHTHSFPHLASLPKFSDGVYLYAFEASDSSIKVGRSYFVRQRFAQHLLELKGRGVRMVRYAIAKPYDDSYATERELVARLARIGTVRPGTNEWFRGIPWGAAYNLLRQITPRQFIVL